MVSSVRSRGYTIVEVLIFLAVSGALMASALVVFGGQQRKTEFTQAIREFDSRINDIINDVSTGFYPNTGEINCVYDPDAGGTPGSGIKLTSGGGATQGSNPNCIFVGRIIQFAPLGVGESGMRVYTVAGQRQVTAPGGSHVEPQNLIQAKAKLIAAQTATDTTPDAFEDIASSPALRIAKVCYKTCADLTEEVVSGVGIFSTFGSYKGNSLQSGTISAELAPLNTTPVNSGQLNRNHQEFVASTNTKLNGGGWNDVAYKQRVNEAADSGVMICLLSTGTNQHVVLKIGGDFRQLTTELTFNGGNNESDCP